MTYETYRQAHDLAVAHYQKGEFAEAMAIFNEALALFPDDRADIEYFRSCLAVRLDKAEITYQILDDLLVDGTWFSEDILRTSPSYAPLQGHAEFEKRVDAHKAARIASGDEPEGGLKILDSAVKGDDQRPLVFLLHGNGSSATTELAHWQSAADSGWLVAAPASKSIFWAGGVSFWPDHETARPQLERHLGFIKQHHPIDSGKTIFAGFSMGGDIALSEALKGELAQPCGFILVGPGGPLFDEPDSFRPLIEAAKGRSLRGAILVSKSDGAIDGGKIETVAEMLNTGGFPTKLISYPDEGHVYPADFGKRLPGLFDWVLSH